LGGGGARGAAQVGVLQALFEAGVEPPTAIVGTSVGALNGSAIAAYPSLAGSLMLREIWLSKEAAAVFRVHPLNILVSGLRRDRRSALPQQNVRRLIDRALTLSGVTSFEQLTVPLTVVATDLNAGKAVLFKSGRLVPALLASTAIPGLFPAVRINDREHLDGGVVDNTPLAPAIADGAKDVIAISLMGGGEFEPSPKNLAELMARTLQLSIHHKMLSDFERLTRSARIVVLCPVTDPTETWEMKRLHVEALVESSRHAAAMLLRQRGSKLFRHSAIHYLNLA
jgi:NTE family protein